MCLAKVTESYEPPCPMITDGWKDLGGDPKKPVVGMAVNGSSHIPLDTWVTATNEHAKNGIKATDGNTYEPGFHVYADEPAASYDRTRQRRVFVRNITCRGTDGGKTTLIAREMYIPSDPNGWPPKGNGPKSGGGNKKRPNPIKKMIDKTIADMKGMGVTPGQA